MKFFWLLLITLTFLGGTEVKIASYNVENLFDMNDDGTEYEQYIPNTSWGWNEEMHRIKLRNTAQVIKDIGADVIGLQEIESETALKELKAELNRQGIYYPHYAFSRTKNTSVSVALLSKYPIKSALSHPVSASREFRDILEVKLDINGKFLRVFINHWKSKSGPESMRVQSAKVLKKRLNELDKDEVYVLLGDFNSHYEEYRTFVKSRKHNDTDGITGINHILKTIDEDENPITLTSLKECDDCSYNLWYELPQEQRWSHEYRGEQEALDNMIISPSLADGKGVEYVRGSFGRFDAPYLFYKGKPYRWQQSRKFPKHHLGEGYSDHLAIFAKFNVR
ncbi:MAG: endonuclease/exonuclease/phosphatase family protein [Campylobacterales bacterium]|nr:endonuclease/exonuclease/phosphatase family protein [Campylobacterales bacterium]